MRITSLPQVYRHGYRWAEILSILSKYGLADWISRLGIEFAKGLLKSPQGEAIARLSWEQRVRLALTELGPTFVKLGQALSTRPDLVGVALADELQHLQDEAPADPPEKVLALLEKELGAPTDKVFAQFDPQPAASASIGQVHKARLHTGQTVAVKVRHPGVERKIAVDLEILAALAYLAERLADLRYYRPRAVVAEFRRMILHELDFTREQRNMLEFARNFAGDPTIRIPRPFTELCTPCVLTMEWIDGIKLSSKDQLAAQGFDLKEIAQRGARIYLEMIFRHGFFHADPHPGNIVLMPGNVIGLLDFGMVGRIDEHLHEDVEDMLLAVANQDAEQLADILARIGRAPEDLDRSAFCLDLADFVAHYGNTPVEKLDLSGLFRELLEMIRQYRIILPPRLALLIKVLVNLEGTARMLSPGFSLLELMAPYRREMMLHRFSPKRQWRLLQRVLRQVERLAETLPRVSVSVLEQLQTGRLQLRMDQRGLESAVDRLSRAVGASALLLGSALLLAFKVPPLLTVQGQPVSVLGALGFVAGLYMVFRTIRQK